MNAFALEPIPHSRSTLVAVVVAHVAAALLVVQLFEARRHIDPVPLMVDLLQAPQEPQEEKVDVLPRPLPPAPKPEPVVERKPEPRLDPVVREEPKPMERVVLPEPEPAPPEPEPAPRVAPPPPVVPPVATPTPPPPMPEPVVAAPEAITMPVPPAPVVQRQPDPAPVTEVPEIMITQQMLTAAYRSNPKPAYPGASRRLGEQGTVLLRVFVTALGDATRVELKTSSGFPRLDQAAHDAVQRWKFEPARRGEQAVDAWVLVPIKFSLKG